MPHTLEHKLGARKPELLGNGSIESKFQTIYVEPTFGEMLHLLVMFTQIHSKKGSFVCLCSKMKSSSSPIFSEQKARSRGAKLELSRTRVYKARHITTDDRCETNIFGQLLFIYIDKSCIDFRQQGNPY